MFRNRLTAVHITFLCLIFCLPGVLSSRTKQPYNVLWSVLNMGGETEEATSASYRLRDAIGQTVIGTCESASYKTSIGFWSAEPLWVVGIEEKAGGLGALPLVYSLSQNYPNPMGNMTQIEYALPAASWISIRIYSITGQLIKKLVDELQDPGQYNIVWYGRDEKGRRAASGIYFYKIQAGDYTEMKKLILVR